MKDKYKLAFMDMAERFALTSEAVRLKVGTLLVKDGHIIAEGVNGMPPGWPTEDCEYKQYLEGIPEDTFTYKSVVSDFPYEDDFGKYRLVTKHECRHSEIAALEKLWKSHETSDGAEAYISHSPCLNCSIKLKTAGIKKVYYRSEYRDLKGIEYLKANNVEVEQI